jgi:hypothetical protein
MLSLTSPNPSWAQLRHSSARAAHPVQITAATAAAVVLLASAGTLANAAENAARLAQEQHACAAVLGLDPSTHRYNACLRSLDQSLDRALSERAYARSVSTDRNTCDRDGLQPGMPAFAVCVEKAVRSQ